MKSTKTRPGCFKKVFFFSTTCSPSVTCSTKSHCQWVFTYCVLIGNRQDGWNTTHPPDIPEIDPNVNSQQHTDLTFVHLKCEINRLPPSPDFMSKQPNATSVIAV